MGAVDFLVGHNVPNYIFFPPVLSFSRSLTPCALSSLVVCKENSINLFAKLECLLHESVWRCLPPRSPRIVNYSFSSRTKQNLTTLSRSLWPRFQPLSGLAFNLSLASLSTSLWPRFQPLPRLSLSKPPPPFSTACRARPSRRNRCASTTPH